MFELKTKPPLWSQRIWLAFLFLGTGTLGCVTLNSGSVDQRVRKYDSFVAQAPVPGSPILLLEFVESAPDADINRIISAIGVYTGPYLCSKERSFRVSLKKGLAVETAVEMVKNNSFISGVARHYPMCTDSGISLGVFE
jgi:hypothetical protein